MEKIEQKHFSEERALFSSKDLYLEDCTFSDGESPLKESQDIELYNCVFSWKYPLWYCQNVIIKECELMETARSGIWYTNNINVSRTTINAPKIFRYSKKIVLSEVQFNKGDETLWNCENIQLRQVKTIGDYFGFHSKDIEADNLEVYGNYLFDSCENVVVRNSYLRCKDAFWNCKNVTLINCTIIGEYIGWNTENMTLINCKVQSHQGFCYIDGLKMYNCEVTHSDLIFEYCHNLDVEITTVVDSIKNPYDGKIAVAGVKELILDKRFIDRSKIKIIRK